MTEERVETTETPWYDNPVQMAERLKVHGLDGLHEIMRSRNEACYVHGARLNEWIVLGRWLMDTCGNTMIFTKGAAPGGAKLVETKREYADRTGGVSWSATFGRTPKRDSRCIECDEGWTLASCHDVIDTENSPEPLLAHVGCYRSQVARGAVREFAEAATAAGFPGDQLRLQPNGYCPCDHCPPWFQFDYGAAQITLGWRKRVVHIEWHGVDVDGTVLFEDVTATKNRFYVHAWGMKEVVAHLSRLREHLPAPKPGDRPVAPGYETVVIGSHLSVSGGRR